MAEWLKTPRKYPGIYRANLNMNNAKAPYQRQWARGVLPMRAWSKNKVKVMLKLQLATASTNYSFMPIAYVALFAIYVI